MQTVDVKTLLGRYRGLLLDAYGVLVDAGGVLPGAADFLDACRAAGVPFLVVTNDGSRSLQRLSERMRGYGLEVTPEQVISSASLLHAHFAAHGLHGASTYVLGPPDAFDYVRRAGGVPLDTQEAAVRGADCVVVCDLPQDNSFASLARALDVCVAALDAGRPLRLVLCNPDVVYPAGGGRFGLTSGAAMLLLEAGLCSRFGDAGVPEVARLGKPYPAIFDAACARIGTRDVAMLGDQLATDVRGANDYGIDSVLVGTGLTKVVPGARLIPSPTWYLPAVGAA